MKKLFRFGFSMLPLGLLLGGCSSKTVVSDAEREQFQNELKSNAKRAKSSMQGIEEAIVKGGKIEIGDAQGNPLWQVQAKEMRTKGQTDKGVPKTAILTDAGATLFRAGKPESSFKAKTIHLFNSSSGVRLQMVGQVVATSQTLGGAPIEMHAPRADVDVSKRTLSASGGVAAKRGDVTLNTPQLTGQTSLQTLQCQTATILARGTTVRGQSVNYNWKSNHLSATNATATREKTTLSGQKIEADTANQRGTLTGNVQAKAPNGTASGPRLDFNWKNDRFFVPNGTFQGHDATVRTAALTTDSKLRVTNAQNVRIEQNSSTLTVQNARGLENLSRLSGSGVTFSRGDLKIEAGAASTNNWSKENGSIQASGGVVARNSQGTVRARTATWSGGTNGRVTANGGVQITSPNGTLRGASGETDAKFRSASLSGDVSGNLRDGTRIRAARLQKQGDNFIASRGASATLPDGTQVSASRVEGNANSAVATGGASAIFKEGTRLRASRVEKRGNNVVATGSVHATLPKQGTAGRIDVTAARVEGDAKASHVVATGGVVLRSQSGAIMRAPQAVYDRATGKITATGGVSIVDPEHNFSQTGKSLVANLNLKQVIVDQGNGQINLKGKDLGLF